ncbi:MAG: DUF4397 domain-containing protein [Planctomycetes bacterium]|nr:DUF4397 domain-containing protein [Planctomycetota bacterium]
MKLRTLLSFVVLSAAVAAQDAKLTVIHGIPGLPANVEVFANGNPLFTFGYGDVKGPLSLPAGTYDIAVKLQGNTVLSAKPTVSAGVNYTAIAGLQSTSGIALNFYVNDLKAAASGQARVAVRHNAMAPAVDVLVAPFATTNYVKLAPGLENPKEAVADVNATLYYVRINPKDSNTSVFGPVGLWLRRGYFYGVHAIGEVGKRSFRLVTTRFALDAGSNPKLVGLVRGKSCGGSIGISTQNPEFDKAFDVTLSGAAKSGFGFLHIGASDSRLLFFRLPIANFLTPGCTLYQSTEMIQPIRTDDKGEASRSLTIPSSMASRFSELHFQYSFLDGRTLKLTDYASVERQ